MSNLGVHSPGTTGCSITQSSIRKQGRVPGGVSKPSSQTMGQGGAPSAERTRLPRAAGHDAFVPGFKRRRYLHPRIVCLETNDDDCYIA